MAEGSRASAAFISASAEGGLRAITSSINAFQCGRGGCFFTGAVFPTVAKVFNIGTTDGQVPAGRGTYKGLKVVRSL